MEGRKMNIFLDQMGKYKPLIGIERKIKSEKWKKSKQRKNTLLNNFYKQ